MSADYRLLIQLADGALQMHDAAPAARPTLFRRRKQELESLRAENKDYHREPERRRLFAAIMRRMPRLRGGIVGWYAWLDTFLSA